MGRISLDFLRRKSHDDNDDNNSSEDCDAGIFTSDARFSDERLQKRHRVTDLSQERSPEHGRGERESTRAEENRGRKTNDKNSRSSTTEKKRGVGEARQREREEGAGFVRQRFFPLCDTSAFCGFARR